MITDTCACSFEFVLWKSKASVVKALANENSSDTSVSKLLCVTVRMWKLHHPRLAQTQTSKATSCAYSFLSAQWWLVGRKDKTEKNREIHSVSATELIKPFKLSLGRNSKDLWTCFYTAPRYYKASSIIICPQLSLDKYYLLIGASVRNSIRGRDN